MGWGAEDWDGHGVAGDASVLIPATLRIPTLSPLQPHLSPCATPALLHTRSCLLLLHVLYPLPRLPAPVFAGLTACFRSSVFSHVPPLTDLPWPPPALHYLHLLIPIYYYYFFPEQLPLPNKHILMGSYVYFLPYPLVCYLHRRCQFCPWLYPWHPEKHLPCSRCSIKVC